MRTPPPEVIASWPKPNYMNPSYQGPQLLIVSVTLLVCSSILVGLRLWVCLQMKRSARWDDWIMIAAVLFIIRSTVTPNLGTKYGWGYHVWDLPTLRYLSWGIISLILSWGLCIPLRAYWDTSPYSIAECSDEQARTLAFTKTNLIFYIIILILTVSILWKIQFPIRERLVFIGLMSLGIVACAASAVRLYYANRIYNVSYDITWDAYQLWLWVLVEINLAVICASIPTIRPLVRRYLPQLGFKGFNCNHDNIGDVTITVNRGFA
ncbi:hypothetical protein P168DRAFT_337402 [Aspergillus campestris IBT 28561]|uniref:Rhodopsin domain-containing protein n=1 Tax=Aspergillus campestris (strain IBT 28561) TaxID=1392248 RepID=A0A2I1CR54_ASPC2|nr:uncharacterized protein P168DRAFT_337402 [Aspergillus campestris IBT 28561]PKY00111.1 hypothetical protein P168DRAFT_337402 [Aspergillus campestris IBT 28561]